MSPPGTPVLGNGTLTLPLNPTTAPLRVTPQRLLYGHAMACPYVRMTRGLASTQVGPRPMITTARSIVRFRLCVQVNPRIVSE